MTLLITAFAAVITTIVWYCSDKARNLKIGTLTLAYWGASVMWLVDAASEYIERGAAFFIPSSSEMQNDAFLGFSVIAVGLIAWTVFVLVKDPNGTIKNIFIKSK